MCLRQQIYVSVLCSYSLCHDSKRQLYVCLISIELLVLLTYLAHIILNGVIMCSMLPD